MALPPLPESPVEDSTPGFSALEKQYILDFNPAGDSVKTGVWKNDQNIDNLFAGINDVYNNLDGGTTGTHLSAGMVAAPTMTDNGDGSVTVAADRCALFLNKNKTGVIQHFDIPEKRLTLTDLQTNYIIVDYDMGDPVYKVTLNVDLITESSIVPVFTIYRYGTELRVLDWSSLGSGLPNKLHAWVVKTNRFTVQSGLGLSEKGTREFVVAPAEVFAGVNLLDLDEVDSLTDNTGLMYNVAGVWTKSAITQYNNSQYDDGTDLQLLGNNRYAVNWVYREVATSGRAAVFLGSGNYKYSEALEASPPQTLPFGLETQAVFVGKIIVKKGDSTATIIIGRVDEDGFFVPDAKAVAIDDAGDYYNGSNVEEALQEIGEVRHWNGFDRQDPDSMGTLAWDSVTRTASVDVKSGETYFHFWASGKKITKTTAQSVVIPDVTGLYYVYFDAAGVLQYTTTPGFDLFHVFAITHLVRWNAVQGSGGAGHEQHGIRKDGTSHMEEHLTTGAKYESGMDIEGLVDGDPDYTQTTSGFFWDEDIRHTVAAKPDGHIWMYRLGVDGAWTTLPADKLVGYNDGVGDFYWNEWTGATWQLTRMGSQTDYGITFFVATPSLDGGSVIKIMGHNAYSSRTNARNAILTEKRNLKLEGLPSTEIVFLYAVIYRRNGELEDLADDSVFFDLREPRGGGGGSSDSTSYAADIPVATGDFDGKLSITDTNVQLALDTLDDHEHAVSEISDFDTAVSNNTDVAANNAKVSNATHTGDVTGNTSLTIANDAVTYAKMQNIPTANILGRVSASNGNVEDLTATQVRTMINVADGANAYAHPSYTARTESKDTGALSGATVISDLDFNISVDSTGHVTSCDITTLATRTLTAANIGALATGGTAVNSDKLDAKNLDENGVPYFRGFKADARHDNFTGDLNTILWNSIYNISSALNAPPVSGLGWGFCHTMMHTNSTYYGTQVVYTMNQASPQIWMRHRFETTWDSWRCVASTQTISTAGPSGGMSSDVWYQV